MTSHGSDGPAPTTGDHAVRHPPVQDGALDDDRRPMTASVVSGAVHDPGRWDVQHVMATGSTNDDLARGGAGPGAAGRATVLVTEEQTAGKGRSGRQWACPPGAGLMFSVRLVPPRIPMARRGWIGAALGLAVVRAFDQVAGVRSTLKWPNDVLVDGLKSGGILAEANGEAVVVGAGLNISLRRSELPRPDATSLALAGAAPVDRNALLAAVLDEFAVLLDAWQATDGDVDTSGLRRRYLQVCATIGASVRLELPGDRSVVGLAVDVDPDGSVVLQDQAGVRTRYSAGDVVHLRSTGLHADAGPAARSDR